MKIKSVDYEQELRVLFLNKHKDKNKQGIFNRVLDEFYSSIHNNSAEFSEWYDLKESSSFLKGIMCVYEIENVKNKRIYVGNTTNMYGRIREHKSNLKKHKHHSKLLQSDYNIHGLDLYRFRIIVITNKSTRVEKEISLTKYYEENNVELYNIWNTKNKYKY